MDLEPGREFAGYSIIRRLGAGGMGEVYLATHPRLPRQDAIKVLPHHLAADEAFRQRFLREADLAATLNHPNIVGVLDRGEEAGRLWLSMPYIDGVDAANRLARVPGGLPLDEVISIVRDTAAALDFAHGKGILHRDVKPANIMLDDSRALLSDFGIARATEDDSDLTATGTTIGSVAYAAPEQLRGDPVDARTDVYSLAATAYTLLTGSRPFDRSTPAAVIAAALDGSYTPVANTREDVSPAIDRAIARGMSGKPADRQRSAGEFASQLTAARIEAPAAPTIIGPGPQPIRADDSTVIARHSEITAARARTTPPRRWILPASVGAILLAGVLAAGTAVMVTRSTTPDTSAGSPTTAVPAPGTVAPTTSASSRSTAAIEASTSDLPTRTLREVGDLGLDRPITRPPCDGRSILVLASVERSNPSVAALVANHLAANPGASYFYSATLNCGSIRAADDNGEAFYTPYIDYGTSSSAACNEQLRRGGYPNGGYVRVLRNGIGTGAAADPCK